MFTENQSENILVLRLSVAPALAAMGRVARALQRPEVHIGCAVRSGASHPWLQRRFSTAESPAAGPCLNADPLRRPSRSMRAAL